MTRDSELSCPFSEKDSAGKHAADVVADSPAGRRSFDENAGEGHSCRVLQLSSLPVCSQENLCGETDENGVAAKCGLESLLFFLTSSGQILVFLVLLFFSSVRSG